MAYDNPSTSTKCIWLTRCIQLQKIYVVDSNYAYVVDDVEGKICGFIDDVRQGMDSY